MRFDGQKYADNQSFINTSLWIHKNTGICYFCRNFDLSCFKCPKRVYPSKEKEWRIGFFLSCIMPRLTFLPEFLWNCKLRTKIKVPQIYTLDRWLSCNFYLSSIYKPTFCRLEPKRFSHYNAKNHKINAKGKLELVN